MKLKTIGKRFISIALSAALLFGTASVCPEFSRNMQGQKVEAVPGIVSGAIKLVGGRVFKEVTTYCMTNDVPFVGTACYTLLCDPSARATIKANGQIQAIYNEVQVISNKLDVMSNQLSTLQTSVDNIYNAIKETDSENDYCTAYNSLKSMYDVYDNYWNRYQDVLDEISAIEDEDYNDPENSAAYNKVYGEEGTYTTLMKSLEVWDNSGDGSQIESLIIKLRDKVGYPGNSIGNLNIPSNSFLGAADIMLRTKTPFEHEISRDMYDSFQYAMEIQFQLNTLYRAYTLYKMSNDENNITDANDPLAEVEKISEEMSDDFIEMITTQMEMSGIADIIVDYDHAKQLLCIQSEMEKDGAYDGIDFSVNDPEIVTPEATLRLRDAESVVGNGEKVITLNVDPDNSGLNTVAFDVISRPSRITVNGKTLKTYYFRDNVSLKYFKIEKDTIALGEDIGCWTNKADIEVYRPNMTLNYNHSADGKYRLISSIEEIPAIKKYMGTSGLISVIENGNMNIEDGGTAFLLYIDQRTLPDNFNGIWNVPFLENTGTVASCSSKTIANDESYKQKQVLRIYTCIETNDSELSKKSSGDYENHTFVLSKGQKLDLSKFTIDIKNVTVYATGACEIIGNPNCSLTDSTIYINTNELVKIKNINICTWKYNDAAVIVNCNDATILLEGTNKFTGNGAVANGSVYSFYDYNYNPVGASHGLLVKNDASLTLTGGFGEFIGSSGGAGICTAGDTSIINADIKATGSKADVTIQQYREHLEHRSNGYYSRRSRLDDETRYSLGAGIGASMTLVKNQEMKQYSDAATYRSYGKIVIDDSTVSATGVKVDSENYAYDVGGFSSRTRRDWSYERVDDDGGTNDYKGRYTNTVYIKRNVETGISSSELYFGNVFLDSTVMLADNNTFLNNYYVVKTSGNYDNATMTMTVTDSYGKTFEYNGKFSNEFVITADNINDISKISLKSDKTTYIDYISFDATLGDLNQTIYIGSEVNTTAKEFGADDHVAKVAIKVPDEKNAGTDATIKLLLKGKNNKETSNVHLDHWDYNDFEKGHTETYYINANGLDEITHARIESDQAGSASGLKIGTVEVESMQGSNAGDKFSIEANQWIITKNTGHVFGRDPNKTGTYKVKIKTSDVKKAGTDSTIWIKLDGKNGETDYVNFSDLDNNASNHNACERGDTDTAYMSFDVYDLGEIEKVYIKKNNSGAGPDWHVEYVEVTPVSAVAESDAPSYRCNVNSWIENGEYGFGVTSTKLKTTNAASLRTASAEYTDEQTTGKTFFLNVDKGYVIKQEILEYIKENGIEVTFNIINEYEQNVYSIHVDGTALTSTEAINTLAIVERVSHGFMVSINDKKGLPEGVSVKINRSELPVEYIDEEAKDQYKDIYAMRREPCGGVSDPRIITDDEEIIVTRFNEMESIFVTHSKAIYNNALDGEEPDLSLLGDANGDGALNVRDCAFVATALSKDEGDTLLATTDYNEDGEINVRDVAAIAKWLAESLAS